MRDSILTNIEIFQLQHMPHNRTACAVQKEKLIVREYKLRKEVIMDFGEKLYRLRIERGIYQKQLAAYLHVSVGTISNYENGVHSPDLKTLCKIANYFHVSADYLLDRTEYILPIGDLDHSLIDQYTSGSVMDTIVELTPEGREDVAKYLAMVAACDNIELPPLSSLGHRVSNFVPPEPEPEIEETEEPEETEE